jgi:hypothetical protein
MKVIPLFAPVILMVLTVQVLHAQVSNTSAIGESVNYDPRLSGELFTSSMSVDESTYFSKVWLIGDIFLSNGEIVRNKLIRYNGLLDELFWLDHKSNNIIKLDKSSIMRFHFINFQGDTSVYFRKIKVKPDVIADSSEVFGQEIYNGRLSLFILHTFFITRREHFYKEGVPYQKSIYEEEPVYYFRFTNNKSVGIKNLNRKNLYTVFPVYKNQIKKFYRQNKQGEFRNNSELIRLTRFLCTLVNQ